MFDYNTNIRSFIECKNMSVGLKLDETKLVKDYILLPLLLDILENDRAQLSRSDVKTYELTNVVIDH